MAASRTLRTRAGFDHNPMRRRSDPRGVCQDVSPSSSVTAIRAAVSLS